MFWALAVAYLAWIVMLLVDPGGDGSDIIVTLILPYVLAVAVAAAQDRGRNPMRWLSAVAPGIVPGLGAGLAVGIALRAGMRVVALAGGIPAIFSVPGTVIVIAVGVILGGGYGALLTALTRSVAGLRSSPGLVGGAGLTVWFWFPFFLAGRTDLSGLVSVPLIALFTTLLSSVWLGFGLLWAAAMRGLGHLPSTAPGGRAQPT